MDARSQTRWTVPPIGGSSGDDCRNWRPIHAGEAFIDGWDPYRTVLARAGFFRLAQETASVAANIASGRRAGTKPLTKPQLAAFFTTCPSRLALEASLGHTAYVEYSAGCGPNPLEQQWSRDFVEHYIEKAWCGHPPRLDLVYEFARLACWSVHSRLLLRELALHPSLRCVDAYRALLALQVHLPPRSTEELLTASVLLADYVLPLLDECHLGMGGLVQAQYEAMRPIVRHFEHQMKDCASFSLAKTGANYVAALVAKVSPLLPRRVLPARRQRPGPTSLAEALRYMHSDPAAVPLPRPGEITEGLAGTPDERPLLDRDLPPMDEPGNSLSARSSPARAALEKVMDALSPAPEHEDAELTVSPSAAVPKFLEVLEDILPSANDGRNPAQACRPDVVERQLLEHPFTRSKLEGEPTSVEWVAVEGWTDGKPPEVQVTSEVAVPPDDSTAWDQLCLSAEPITRRVNARLFEEKRWRSDWRTRATSGPLEPGRLPLLGLSDCICRRMTTSEQDPDRGERSVVLFAVDVSGSMGKNLLSMARLLLCAFGMSLLGRPNHQILAAAYGCRPTTRAERNVCIRWLYHPELTPARTPLEGLQAITLLDESQQGTNLDVPSLACMIKQAACHAGRATLFVVQITDCRFNHCMGGDSGQEEVVRFLKLIRSQIRCGYDHTLIAVGENRGYRLEGTDRILPLPRQGLGDIAKVADRVADFVADALKGRSTARRKS
jgi:hypothetical protein